jgi:hypothetical protein
LDPLGDGGDVGVRELGMGWWWHGHGVVGWAFVTDQFDEQGLLGFAGDNDGTVVAAV